MRKRLRGQAETEKRYLAQVVGFNIGLLMRKVLGARTPKGLAVRPAAFLRALMRVFGAIAS